MKRHILLCILLFNIFNNFIFGQSIEILYDCPNQIYSFFSNNINELFILTSTGELFKTNDYFININLVSKEKNMTDVKFEDINVGYGVDLSNKIYKTSNAGQNWNYIQVNKDDNNIYALFGIHIINKNDILCTGMLVNNSFFYNGIILKKKNNEYIDVFSFPKCYISRIYAYDSNIYYAIGNKNLILRSYDKGSSWTLLTSRNECNIRDIFFLDDNNGYFVGSNKGSGFLLRTFDGCNTWSYQEFPKTKSLNSLYVMNKDSLIILGSESIIYYTANRCENFHKIEIKENYPTTYFNNIFIDNKLIFVATHEMVNEQKGTINRNSSIYKFNIKKYLTDNDLNLSLERFKVNLISFMQKTAESEALNIHPLTYVENISQKNLEEFIDENNSITSECEFTIKLRGSILGIDVYLLKIRITGKLEYDILGEPKYTIKKMNVIVNKKL